MIEIGTIVKPHGIKGEIKVLSNCDLKRLTTLSRIFIEKKEYKIEHFWIRDAFYIKLFGIDNRNEAELLRGKNVFALKDELLPLNKNEFYFNDLIGKNVIDENNNNVGTLEDIEQYGAADVIIIRERNFLFSVPFLSSIFKKINEEDVIINRENYDNMKINY